jgi:hypothetical protein
LLEEDVGARVHEEFDAELVGDLPHCRDLGRRLRGLEQGSGARAGGAACVLEIEADCAAVDHGLRPVRRIFGFVSVARFDVGAHPHIHRPDDAGDHVEHLVAFYLLTVGVAGGSGDPSARRTDRHRLVRSEEPRAGDVERVRQDDDRSCSVPAAERFGEPSLFVRGYAPPFIACRQG